MFTVSDDPDAEIDDDTRALLTADFEIGHYIRESIIPRAVLYFTGTSLKCYSLPSFTNEIVLSGEALMEDEFSEEDEEGDLEEGVS